MSGSERGEMLTMAITVQAQTLCHLTRDPTCRQQHRRAIEPNRFQWRPLYALWECIAGREQLLAEGLGILLEKIRCPTQIYTDHLAVVMRMPSNRRDQRQIVPGVAEHSGDMHQGSQLFEIQQSGDGPLGALPIQGVKQLTIRALK